MYLVRKIAKSGQTQVYTIDGIERGAHGNLRPIKPKAWRFKQGVAAIDKTVDACMLAIQTTEEQLT